LSSIARSQNLVIKKPTHCVGFFSLYPGDSMLRVEVGLVVKVIMMQIPPEFNDIFQILAMSWVNLSDVK